MVFLALFIYKILEGSIQEFWGVEAILFVNTKALERLLGWI